MYIIVQNYDWTRLSAENGGTLVPDMHGKSAKCGIACIKG